MGGIAKGKGNLAQLAAQGNYRAATAQDMGKVYSRNFDQKQIFVAEFPRGTSSENTNAEWPPIDLPEFSETIQGGGASLNQEVKGGKPTDWDLSILQKENS